RETFLQKLKQLMDQPNVEIWFADESGFEGDPRPRSLGTRRDQKNEQQLLERLDQAIVDVIHNPKKTQKTACIATLL
ncbi:MAG: hypothetical protein PVF29_10735, partial [Desulfobacterales bacterium]